MLTALKFAVLHWLSSILLFSITESFPYNAMQNVDLNTEKYCWETSKPCWKHSQIPLNTRSRYHFLLKSLLKTCYKTAFQQNCTDLQKILKMSSVKIISLSLWAGCWLLILKVKNCQNSDFFRRTVSYYNTVCALVRTTVLYLMCSHSQNQMWYYFHTSTHWHLWAGPCNPNDHNCQRKKVKIHPSPLEIGPSNMFEDRAALLVFGYRGILKIWFKYASREKHPLFHVYVVHNINYPVALLPSAGQVSVKQKHSQTLMTEKNGTWWSSFYIPWIIIYTHKHIYTHSQ